MTGNDGFLAQMFNPSPEQQKMHDAFELLQQQIGNTPDYTIHKIAIPFAAGKIKMPLGAQILHVGEQHGTLFAWYIFAHGGEIYASTPTAVVGTGHPIPYTFKKAMQFCKTVQMANGLVWHVFWGEAEVD